ncbi:glycosyl transferase [Azorhizobium oxalatiphilum]|uniref:Glycosyl transferase n=1 Tax=Azorhizobium oxalatiphilum TaxID=980631 RepID=A0A917CAL8_9HYPH|nr:glycosyltransferase family 4 protein [Azorhizobium oxalatiphilum]GGF79737.1 glycosyl transferase [Azorhizobium oxalatiphilum]
MTVAGGGGRQGQDDVWLLVDSSTVGGIETHMGVLAAALMRQGLGVRVILIADHGANPWFAQLDAAGVPHRTLSGGFKGLLAALKAARPRILHTHGYKAGILGRLAAKLAGVPCVSTFHAGERGRFPVSLYQTLDSWTSCLARRIAVSRPIAEGLPFAAEVIGNFVPVPAAPPHGARPDTVGFVGRFSHEKGPDLFCALAEKFAGSGLAFEAFGDGAMRPELQAKTGAAVQFHGLVTTPGAIWPRIGLLLMPSRAEGLPLAAIEAMAAGIPVAASAVGALPDLIRQGENGYLFPAGDLDAMESAVRAWAGLDAAARAAMGEAAWRTARAGYAVDVLLPKVRAVYAAAGARLPGGDSAVS